MKGLVIVPTILNKNSQALISYLKEINKIPQLTKEQELELAQKSFNGDLKAREQLIYSNLKFVISVAKQYLKDEKIELMDLINEGNIGLINASKHFDPTKGFRFISYAVWHIRQKIIYFLTDNGRTIRIASGRSNQLRIVNAEIDKFTHTNERPPTDFEIRELLQTMNLSEKNIDSLLDALTLSTTSLDKMISTENNSDDMTLHNVLKADVDFAVDNNQTNLDIKHISNIMLHNLNNLSSTNKKVVELVYGLNGHYPMHKENIAEMFGVPIYKINKILKQSFKYLRSKTGITNTNQIKSLIY